MRAVLLYLSGIDLHSNSNVGNEPAEWQELLPQLEREPRKVDLLDEAATKTLSAESAKRDRVLIPAGNYDLVRLRFVGNQIRADDNFTEDNKCGNVGPNCVVMADGQIKPLVFVNDTIQVRPVSESGRDEPLMILPDSDNELLIELTPVLQLGTSSGEHAQLFSLLPTGIRVKK